MSALALRALLRALDLGGTMSSVSLVQGAPWQVAEVATALLGFDRRLQAFSEVEQLSRAREGALVLVGIDETGAIWLNQRRNAISARNLRLVLWMSAPLDLRALAPDLDSWTRVRVPLPPAPPDWSVRTLREAPGGRVWWRGGELGPVATLAWPGKRLVEIDPNRVLRERPAELFDPAVVPVFVGVQGDLELRRCRWALAIAKRAGPAVILGTVAEAPGFAAAHAHPMSWKDATKTLSSREDGALQAALAGLEPEAIAILATPLEAMERRVEAQTEAEWWREWEAAALLAPPAEWPNGGGDFRYPGVEVTRSEALTTAALRWPERCPEPLSMELANRWTADGEAGAAVQLAGGNDWRSLLGKQEGATSTTEVERGAGRLLTLGTALQQQGELHEARAALEKALRLLRDRHRSRVHPDLAMGLHALAAIVREQGDLQGAKRLLEEAVEGYRLVPAPLVEVNLSTALHDLGVVTDSLGDREAARDLLEQSLDMKRRIFGTDAHPQVFASLYSLASWLHGAGRLTEARARFEELVLLQEQVAGGDASIVFSSTLHGLAQVQAELGDLSGARASLERSLSVDRRVHGTDRHPSVAATLSALASVLRLTGDYARAVACVEQSLRIQRAVYGTDEHLDIASGLHLYALLKSAIGDLTGARSLLAHCLAIRQRLLGVEHPSLAVTMANLAQVDLRLGRMNEGIAGLRRAHHLQVLASGAESLAVAEVELMLGNALIQAQRRDKARPFLAHAAAVLRAADPNHPSLSAIARLLGDGPSDGA